ncbi:hypothetical protein BGZ52_004937, partial [Haplosporangium bisporale]
QQRQSGQQDRDQNRSGIQGRQDLRWRRDRSPSLEPCCRHLCSRPLAFNMEDHTQAPLAAMEQ